MSKAFTAAFLKGAQARRNNQSRASCPYEDIRDSYKNSVTFSRAFRRSWHDGWDNPNAIPGLTSYTKLSHTPPKSETPQ